MRDMRDQTALGERMIKVSESLGVPMTKVYDEVICDSGVAFVDASTSLERYGDPVARHQERIAAGIEVVLS